MPIFLTAKNGTFSISGFKWHKNTRWDLSPLYYFDVWRIFVVFSVLPFPFLECCNEQCNKALFLHLLRILWKLATRWKNKFQEIVFMLCILYPYLCRYSRQSVASRYNSTECTHKGCTSHILIYYSTIIITHTQQ